MIVRLTNVFRILAAALHLRRIIRSRELLLPASEFGIGSANGVVQLGESQIWGNWFASFAQIVPWGGNEATRASQSCFGIFARGSLCLELLVVVSHVPVVCWFHSLTSIRNLGDFVASEAVPVFLLGSGWCRSCNRSFLPALIIPRIGKLWSWSIKSYEMLVNGARYTVHAHR